MPSYVSHSGLSNYTGHGHGYSEKLSRKHFIVLIFSHSAINVIGHNANNVICLTTKSDIRLYTVKSVLLSNGFSNNNVIKTRHMHIFYLNIKTVVVNYSTSN